ncbi:hypothetical protein [Sulfitobacter sp. EE-36]|uniref:hypothetical protein n=1 Tax=Sulfitobacter TaxID=60136 RepID=UPI0000669C5C|nr:hypothetical protein [Sulfitobacter sp. EE-36]EAP83407.1 hypothetical protein EE36_00310 [Sulfitobacter sp. EE-36]
MTLTNLIDLIAEVAAKRATEEGRTKEETPSAVIWIIAKIPARLWQPLHNVFNFGLYSKQRRPKFAAQGDSK